jgi:hypothetical protein
MSQFDRDIIDMINASQRLADLQPLVLGGGSGPSGGTGGPSGGIDGQLVQTYVAYDETEAESILIPDSGVSLLDNLNHIRYNIDRVDTRVSNMTNAFMDYVNNGTTTWVTYTHIHDDFSSDYSGSRDNNSHAMGDIYENYVNIDENNHPILNRDSGCLMTSWKRDAGTYKVIDKLTTGYGQTIYPMDGTALYGGAYTNFYLVNNFVAPGTGTYNVDITMKGGIKIWCNGTLVLDDWSPTDETINRTDNFSVAMTEGTRYLFQIEYFNGSPVAFQIHAHIVGPSANWHFGANSDYYVTSDGVAETANFQLTQPDYFGLNLLAQMNFTFPTLPDNTSVVVELSKNDGAWVVVADKDVVSILGQDSLKFRYTLNSPFGDFTPSIHSLGIYVPGSVTTSYNDERAQDAIGSAINAGSQTGIEVTYNDSSNSFDFNVTVSSGGLEDAPADGTIYGRKNSTWEPVPSGGGNSSVGWQTIDGADNIEWDLGIGNALVVLSGNGVLDTPINMTAGQHYFATVLQDSSGGHSLSFGNGFKFSNGNPPTISTDPSTEDLLTFECNGSYLLNTGIFKNMLSISSTLTYSTNLIFWLKANADVYADDGINLVNSNDTVYRWKDQSGHSNDAIQTDGDHRPQYVTGVRNGLPAIRFNSSTGTWMDIDGLTGGDSVSFFIVVYPTTSTPIGIFDTAPGEMSTIRNSPGGYWEWWNSAPMVDMALPDANPVLLEFIHTFDTTRNVDYYNNGILISNNPDAATGGIAWVNPNIGSINTTESYLDGDVAEILIYNESIGSTNRILVETYLKTKYGIA